MEIIKEGIQELNISKKEPIQLCRGNIFDLARLYLKENGYKVDDTKIEGKHQLLVEQAFLSLIEKLGVDINKISLEAGRERFYSLFYWVSDDYPKRKAFVKSGMKAWIEKWDKNAKIQYEKKNSKLASRIHGHGTKPRSQQYGNKRDYRGGFKKSSTNRRNDSRRDDQRQDQRNFNKDRSRGHSGINEQNEKGDRDERRPNDRKKYSSVSNDPKSKFF